MRHGVESSGWGGGDPARVAFASFASFASGLVKYPPLPDVYGDTAGEAAPFPSSTGAARVGVPGSLRNRSDDSCNVARGRCSSRILMIAARCVPASTASTDPFAHRVAVDRTRKPVTLSSHGPPPEPYVKVSVARGAIAAETAEITRPPAAAAAAAAAANRRDKEKRAGFLVCITVRG